MRIVFYTVLFFHFGMLHPNNLKAQDSLFLKESIQKWQNATAYTLELAKSMPFESYDFKPVEDERSFSEQLEHIGENMTWLAGTYLGGRKFEHPLLEKKVHTPEETVELLEASFLFAQQTLDNLSPDSLNVVCDFFAGPMTRRQIINLMHDHHTHHRGQLIVYLRLKGIKPPKYRGW
ncbi:MAG: DinB family protein [Saprospiraceae bacterium]|nr:DinB family protein [Saprospiraceae bacterium]